MASMVQMDSLDLLEQRVTRDHAVVTEHHGAMLAVETRDSADKMVSREQRERLDLRASEERLERMERTERYTPCLHSACTHYILRF
jgi:hypothetical protein